MLAAEILWMAPSAINLSYTAGASMEAKLSLYSTFCREGYSLC